MDKSNDVNKRLTSENKKNGASKTVLKNSHIAIKSNPPRKFSYVSRAKNVSNHYENKKYNVYASDTKSFLKQTCDKCKIETGTHLVVNTAPVKPHTQLSKIDANHDLNGNLSFNPRTTFCNFPSVSEVPNFSLNYPSRQRYELSMQKSSKHRTRPGYHEKRTYNPKVTNSKVSFHSNKFFASLPHSNISYQNSKSNPSSLSNAIPFIKLSTNRMCGTTLVSDKLNPKCFIQPGELMNEQITTDIKITNFPVYTQSNLPGKACFAIQVDPENQMCNVKSDYFIHKWQQISVASLFENSSKESDKSLFPALPSNVQNEQMKSNYCTGNGSLSEILYDDQSDLESANMMPRIVSNESSMRSNTSTINPQASYADVIRMSGSCNSSVEDFDKVSDSEQSLCMPMDKKEESSQSGGSDWVISRLSQQEPQSQNLRNLPLNHYNPNIQSSVNPHPIAVSLEKPSFYNSTLQNLKLHNISPLSPTISSEKFIKVDDIINNVSSSEENGDKMSSSSSAYSFSHAACDHAASTYESKVTCLKQDSIYTSACSISSINNSDKLWNKKSTSKNKEFPVIIMNSCSSDNLSEISFGIEHDEMIKLCFDDCDLARENASISSETDKEKLCSEKNIKSKNSPLKHLENKVICNEDLLSQANLNKRLNDKLLLKEATLYWKESEVKYDESNHLELTNYFASLWKECERGPNAGLPDGDKIQIYQERK